MKRTALMIVAVVVSLLLIANPAFAGQGNGKFAGGGKAAAFGALVAEKAVRNVQVTQEKQVRNLQFKFRLQKREKTVATGEFRDVEKHWAKNCIEKVRSLGWISGYPDMTFRPDAPVTGIEVVAMVVSLAEDLSMTDDENAAAVSDDGQAVVSEGETAGDTSEVSEATGGEEEEPVSADVPAWAKGAMKKAVALKIVNVNRFHSQVQATRAQAAVMLAKALGLQPVDTSNLVFKDQLLISPEDLGYILALTEAGIIKGTPDGKFNPNSAITRAEIAAMLANVADGSGGENSDSTVSEGSGGGTADQDVQQPGEGQISQPTSGSAEQTLTQPAEQTTTTEGGMTAQAQQTASEAV